MNTYTRTELGNMVADYISDLVNLGYKIDSESTHSYSSPHRLTNIMSAKLACYSDSDDELVATVNTNDDNSTYVIDTKLYDNDKLVSSKNLTYYRAYDDIWTESLDDAKSLRDLKDKTNDHKKSILDSLTSKDLKDLYDKRACKSDTDYRKKSEELVEKVRAVTNKSNTESKSDSSNKEDKDDSRLDNLYTAWERFLNTYNNRTSKQNDDDDRVLGKSTTEEKVDRVRDFNSFRNRRRANFSNLINLLDSLFNY